MNTKQGEQGFTLIELIVVIVILGFLAAVAVPRFIDLRQDAKNAAGAGIASAISSASAINYAARIAGNTNTVAVGTGACEDIANTLLVGGTGQYSATWQFGTGTVAACNLGQTRTCPVQSTAAPAVTATATIICTG